MSLVQQWFNIVAKMKRGLPAEYREVEYLESTGVQWIDTGIIAGNLNLKFEIKFNASSNQIDEYPRIFAAQSGNTLLGLGTRFWYGNVNQNRTDMIPVFNNTDHIAICDKNGLILDGSNYNFSTIPTTRPPMSYTIFLFASHADGTAANYSLQKNYYTKIWDNDVLVRNLVPCYRKADNKPGMYDLVNNVFYVNRGTGADFIAGPDVLGVNYNQLIPNNLLSSSAPTSVVPTTNKVGSYISIINPIPVGHRVYAKLVTDDSRIRCCWYKNSTSGYDFSTGQLLDESSDIPSSTEGVYEITQDMIYSDGYLQLYWFVGKDLPIGSHTVTLQLIDLTALGMGNIINVPIFKATLLGKIVDKQIIHFKS